jgi:hypothetical protein
VKAGGAVDPPRDGGVQWAMLTAVLLLLWCHRGEMRGGVTLVVSTVPPPHMPQSVRWPNWLWWLRLRLRLCEEVS